MTNGINYSTNVMVNFYIGNTHYVISYVFKIQNKTVRIYIPFSYSNIHHLLLGGRKVLHLVYLASMLENLNLTSKDARLATLHNPVRSD